jgi:hypothetical protein
MLDWRSLPRTEEPHLGGLRGKVDRRLPGGISGAHEGDLLARNEFAFERRRPVVHARGLELFEVWHVEPPVASTTGDDDCASTCSLGIEKAENELASRPVHGLEAEGFIWYCHFDPEFLSLVVGARHQRHARDTRGEP